MSALFDVSLRSSESIDQEISKALFGTCKILRRIHAPQNVVRRDLAIKCPHEAREAFFANDSVNAGFVHSHIMPLSRQERSVRIGCGQ